MPYKLGVYKAIISSFRDLLIKFLGYKKTKLFNLFNLKKYY
jgi:hypothetical protein